MLHTLGMLVRKDLAQQRQRLFLGSILMFFFGLGFQGGPDSGTSLVASGLVGLIMVTAMGSAYDDDHGGLVFLRSLPLPAHELVAGKFVSMLVFALTYCVAGLLPVTLTTNRIIPVSAIAGVLASAAAGLVLAGIVLVVFYRYGYRAVQHAFLYVMVGIVALGFLMTVIFQKLAVAGPPSWLNNLVGKMDGRLWISGNQVALLVALVIAGIYLTLGWLASHNLRVRDL